MKTGTTSKVKFKRLQRRLDLSMWQAVGVLEAIWNCTYENASDGAIGRLSNEDIAASIEWKGSADALVDALVDSGWLDRDDEFRLIVHDWSEHCSNFLRGNFAKHHKMFADEVAKQRTTLDSNVAKQPQTDSANGATKPNLTKPNLTTPTSPPSGGCSAADGGGGGEEEFRRDWKKAISTAERLHLAITRDANVPLGPNNRRWVIKVAILSVRFGNQWIDPAFEAVANTTTVRSVRGLMSSVLSRECIRLGTDLNRELAQITIPAMLLNPPQANGAQATNADNRREHPGERQA